MDFNMRVTEAIQLRDDMKKSIESMMLVYSAATGLDMIVRGGAGVNPDGTAYSECGIQVNLPDQSPLAKEPSGG